MIRFLLAIWLASVSVLFYSLVIGVTEGFHHIFGMWDYVGLLLIAGAAMTLVWRVTRGD